MFKKKERGESSIKIKNRTGKKKGKNAPNNTWRACFE